MSAYRDHADSGSMLIGTVSSEWAKLDPKVRRTTAEIIRLRVRERGVK